MFRQSLGVALAFVLVVAAVGAIPDPRSDVTVHEWGTFTTVAGKDGRAVAWRPLDGPVDLPCFVERADLPPKFSFVTTVRMETPVIYFYSPRPQRLDVAVGFRQGFMTEFYPRPTSSGERYSILPGEAMHLEWKGVRLSPGSAADYRSDGASNHYYAARVADAAPLEVGAQTEGFLFYRGVGGFELPLRATVGPGGIHISNHGVDPIPALMLFENRGGHVGFQTSGWAAQLTVPRVSLDSNIASVRAALLGMLIDEGLYTQEAEAMIETWSGSWFEEGTRVFYVVPRPLVDRTLPLNISPAPGAVKRVFIGRLEIATPELLDDLRAAFAALDHETLATHGRFLGPFTQRLVDSGLPPYERARIDAALAAAMKRFGTGAAKTCATTTRQGRRGSSAPWDRSESLH